MHDHRPAVDVHRFREFRQPFVPAADTGLNVIDRGSAKAEAAKFDEDLARSRKVTLEERQSQPLAMKAADARVALLRSQL